MGLIKFILGADSRSALKRLNKLANKVEELEPKYSAMSDHKFMNFAHPLCVALCKIVVYGNYVNAFSG